MAFKHVQEFFFGGRRLTSAAPAFWRLDARLGWKARPNLELFVSGQNLLFASHQEYIDGLSVPRTIQGGATLRY